jgi:hypothetical protein
MHEAILTRVERERDKEKEKERKKERKEEKKRRGKRDKCKFNMLSSIKYVLK